MASRQEFYVTLSTFDPERLIVGSKTSYEYDENKKKISLQYKYDNGEIHNLIVTTKKTVCWDENAESHVYSFREDVSDFFNDSHALDFESIKEICLLEEKIKNRVYDIILEREYVKCKLGYSDGEMTAFGHFNPTFGKSVDECVKFKIISHYENGKWTFDENVADFCRFCSDGEILPSGSLPEIKDLIPYIHVKSIDVDTARIGLNSFKSEVTKVVVFQSMVKR